MSHSWSTQSGQYSVSANSPDDLRKIGREYVARAVLRGPDYERRGQIYLAEADVWERQLLDDAERTAANRKARAVATRRRKDEFTATYGSGAQRDRARARIGWVGEY